MSPALRHLAQRLGIVPSALVPFAPSDPTSVYYAAVKADDAQSLWNRGRALVHETGFWPLVLGDDDDLEHHREAWEDMDKTTTQAILAQAASIDSDQWLQSELKELLDELDADEENENDLFDEEGTDWYGDWPENEAPATDFHTFVELRRHAEMVYLGFVPTRRSHEVPAFLRFGGWNACPFAHYHVAALRRWEELYGAEIVVATHSVIELRVARPPQTRGTALALAEEQFAYCADIVTQGTGTLSDLAAILLYSPVWYFWWD